MRARKSAANSRVASAVHLPTTKATTNRLCGWRATWSQPSPAIDSSGSRFRCVRATNDHFSSNWTSSVVGGKSDPLVAQEVGVIAGGAKVPGDDVAVDADK